MAEKLRIVMAGCGGMSRAWLEPVGKRDDVEVVGLVDIQEAAARTRQDDFALTKAEVFTNLKDALDTLEPDIVFDCTVPEAHHGVTLEALAHGCHVMGEKPLADSMDHALEMVRAARAANRLYAVIQNRRYDPRIRGFRDFLASGQIGSLTTLNSDFYLGAHFGGFRERMEHVLLLDMAIHTFDQARLISGADPMAVYCFEWNPRGSWYDHDASAAAIFEMTNGLIYTYRGSWCAEGLSTSWECDWRAIGETGTALWDGGDGFKAQRVKESEGFTRTKEDLAVEVSTDGKSGGHAGLIDEFIRCVRDGGTPETVASDNIKSLAMVFGAIDSARSGERVEIRVGELV